MRRGVRGLRQIARWPRNRPGQRVLILLYHRVAELRLDPWFLSVTPRTFAEHLEVLQRHAHPISLQRLFQGLLEGGLPERAVAVTFDDGYADNLHDAKPLLARYEVPATVFLATGYIGHEREFWWDELDRLLLQPGTLPEVLRLKIAGRTYQWELGEAAYSSEDATRRRRRWRAWGGRAPNSRHHLYFSLWELLYPLAEVERQESLYALRAWADAEPVVRPTHRPLSLQEVVALRQGELIEVGAHTVTHPALATLPIASQQNEILESKVRLEEILGCRVSAFSYPHSSLSAETVVIVRKAGFACACTAFAGRVGQLADPFRLPREHVQDWDGREFTRRLMRWFEA
jgi:peptidoglycan/xylan/chitin deacetylase (PgdA/CDA1 family)